MSTDHTPPAAPPKVRSLQQQPTLHEAQPSAAEPARPGPSDHDQTSPYLPTAHAVLLALAVIGMAVDILLVKAALDVVLNESQLVSACLAVGIALVAAATSAGGGYALRRGHRVVGSLTMCAWFVIGLSLALLRWNHGSLVSGGENTTRDMILALLMLCVYIAAGIEIAVSAGILLDRDIASRANSARRSLNRSERRRRRVAAQYARADRALSRIPDHRKRAARQHGTAQARINWIERELMAYSRDLVAEALASPASTGVIRQPRAER